MLKQDIDMNERLASFIRAYLEKRGWSARRLAAELNVASATITNILNGTTEEPKTDFLKKLARVTGTSYFRVRMMADPQLNDELEALIGDLPADYQSLPREILDLAKRLYRLPPEVRTAILTIVKAEQ